MAFHITVVIDFPAEELVVARGLSLYLATATPTSTPKHGEGNNIKVD
jgi:hypothetical protein